ncbi:iron sulfur cluster assembly protein 1, mitochondrial precursor [Suhomyces tanzawaensis NRRL Y-17324]|uniref:Iron-sulfur cluster assembly protein n=1 Tax=Suhomyces tanzawaensis NRRL Y-17324 TaxID=984487 RepID=A0A1E4SH70_9ASCO|nr:iron sulfur cluster assembly protein 1, mitochondrial precursor [Suhomyces tanzawaensis NRRL Y-17324]ODV78851.1 iron sulfur cluster assembly protein 1, mitochondrial precursor [Suhomyces tanzawaensis NRRL Y-17324]
MFRSVLRTSAIQASRSASRPIIGRVGPAISAPVFNVSSVRSYHEKVLDHYQNPRNVGTLNKNDINVGTGLVGAPACGDVMRLQIQVDEETGTIKDVKFKTFGCGSAIASSSYVTELVKGKTLEEALKIKNTAIAKELSLPPVKLHCSMLAEDAIKSAVKDYRAKRLVKKPTLGPESEVAASGSSATA